MKKFLIGLLIGAAGMYWYLVGCEDFFAAVRAWFERASWSYSGEYHSGRYPTSPP